MLVRPAATRTADKAAKPSKAAVAFFEESGRAWAGWKGSLLSLSSSSAGGATGGRAAARAGRARAREREVLEERRGVRFLALGAIVLVLVLVIVEEQLSKYLNI